MNYGHQLTVEGVNCRNGKELDSEASVASLLLQCVEAADMKVMQILGNPLIGREPARGEGKGPGITGCALLTESHCVIHTYPEQTEPWFYFELLSCKDFIPEKVIDVLKAWGNPKMTFTDTTLVGRAFPPRKTV
jgi:S-adenosylmethionine/arginine decarboxylase-like enzyme